MDFSKKNYSRLVFHVINSEVLCAYGGYGVTREQLQCLVGESFIDIPVKFMIKRKNNLIFPSIILTNEKALCRWFPCFTNTWMQKKENPCHRHFLSPYFGVRFFFPSTPNLVPNIRYMYSFSHTLLLWSQILFTGNMWFNEQVNLKINTKIKIRWLLCWSWTLQPGNALLLYWLLITTQKVLFDSL